MAQKQHMAALTTSAASTPSVEPSDTGKENDGAEQLQRAKCSGDDYQEVYGI
jgi:hypothetical protein